MTVEMTLSEKQIGLMMESVYFRLSKVETMHNEADQKIRFAMEELKMAKVDMRLLKKSQVMKLENKFEVLNYVKSAVIWGHMKPKLREQLRLRRALKKEFVELSDCHEMLATHLEQLFRERFDFLISKITKIDLGLKKEVPYGYCPDCERNIQGWKPMFGGLAPEWWATMRERGIDPSSGHSKSCPNKKLRIA